MSKRIFRLFSDGEKAFICDAVKSGIHPRDIMDEVQAKFPPGRTYNSLKNVLAEASISFAHLVPKRDQGALAIPQGTQTISPENLKNLAESMGFLLEPKEELRGEKLIEIDVDRFEGKKAIVGLVADTQLGSRYQQLTYLHDAYAYFKKRGIKIVFHAGDLVDGWDVYRGHVHEVFVPGSDAQIDYAVKNYPKQEGITTYAIGGQHDYSFWKKDGCDVLKHIAENRPDIIPMGFFGAYIDIGRKRHYIHHPGGGVAYARSYKTQRMIEEFAPELKPHFLFRGHHHIFSHLLYRNVVAIDLPCFQSQTPYLKEKGKHPELGFLILKFRVNDVGIKDNLAMYELEHFPYFIPKERDY